MTTIPDGALVVLRLPLDAAALVALTDTIEDVYGPGLLVVSIPGEPDWFVVARPEATA